MRIKIFFPVTIFLAFCMASASLAEESNEEIAMRTVDEAIEVMGGQAYLDVDRIKSSGRYFWFNRGRKYFQRYEDWTVMAPVVKSRVRLGKDKQEYLEIVNLEVNKGWKRESEKFIEYFTEEDLAQFRRAVRHDLDYLFRERLSEEGMSLFYYGRDDISGGGKYDAVEFVDAMSDSIVVYFNLDDSRPARTEYHSVDENGVRHKKEQEFYNWHEFQGISVPLRIDTYTDGELSSQRFIEEILFNEQFPETLFLRPEGVEWKPGLKKDDD